MDARVGRLAEPAVLVILAERPTHGYELLERLPALLGAESVDAGNLYRFLRALEADGIVTSDLGRRAARACATHVHDHGLRTSAPRSLGLCPR